jgi:hypothetical protein
MRQMAWELEIEMVGVLTRVAASLGRVGAVRGLASKEVVEHARHGAYR